MRRTRFAHGSPSSRTRILPSTRQKPTPPSRRLTLFGNDHILKPGGRVKERTRGANEVSVFVPTYLPSENIGLSPPFEKKKAATVWPSTTIPRSLPSNPTYCWPSCRGRHRRRVIVPSVTLRKKPLGAGVKDVVDVVAVLSEALDKVVMEVMISLDDVVVKVLDLIDMVVSPVVTVTVLPLSLVKVKEEEGRLILNVVVVAGVVKVDDFEEIVVNTLEVVAVTKVVVVEIELELIDEKEVVVELRPVEEVLLEIGPSLEGEILVREEVKLKLDSDVEDKGTVDVVEDKVKAELLPVVNVDVAIVQVGDQ